MPSPNLADLLLFCSFQERLLHRNNDFHTTEDTRGITQRAKRSVGKQPDTGMSSSTVLLLLLHLKTRSYIVIMGLLRVTLRGSLRNVGALCIITRWPLLLWLFNTCMQVWIHMFSLRWTVWAFALPSSWKQSWKPHGFVGLDIEEHLLSSETRCIKGICCWNLPQSHGRKGKDLNVVAPVAKRATGLLVS